MDTGARGIQALHTTHHIVECAEAEFGHLLTYLLSDEEEKVDDVFGLALEARAQHRVLGRNTDRASVQVALAHHDATHCDQWHCSEAEFFRAEQSSDDHIAAGLQLAVGLHL